MYQRIVDMKCPRCEAVYPSHKTRGSMAILIDHVYLSICPKCTKEIAEMMGYTSENITKTLAQMKEADTERNKQRYIDEGIVCKKCLVKFEWNHPRVKNDDCSNTPAWHPECYESDKEKTVTEAT